MNILYVIASLVLVALCLIGIVSDKFHDNIIQRIAMSGMVLSCVGFVYQMYLGNLPTNFELFVISVSLYAIATTWKLRDGRDQNTKE
jgi:hypothetical protein